MSLDPTLVRHAGVLAIFVCLATHAKPAQTTLFVDAGALPNGDGFTWPTAFGSLQEALAAAENSAGGVIEIRVAQGVYLPAAPDGERTTSFRLINGLTMRGGYAGASAPDPDARRIFLHPSILSGDLNGDDDAPGGSSAENSYHVVTGDATDQTAILDGFTITGGNANDVAIPNDAGGGMRTHAGNPTVVDCLFRGNSARFGGGMENYNGAHPTVKSCIFQGNTATRFGGGMHNNTSNPHVLLCTFIENTAEEAGGGMRNWDQSRPIVQSCAFGFNRADMGGGMANQESYPEVLDCRFLSNVAATQGGGMFNRRGAEPFVANCEFLSNAAEEGDGGAVHSIRESLTTFVNCSFRYNSASGAGGGLGHLNCLALVSNCEFTGNSATFAGGIWNTAGTDITVRSCLLTGNQATDNGGGMDNNSSIVKVIHTTFYGNTSIQGWGGGMWSVNSSSVEVNGCVLWGNTGNSGGSESDQLEFSADSTLAVSYSCIEGLSGLLGGTGNIGRDPQFAGTTYRLSTGSPCINAGDPLVSLEWDVRDLDNHARVLCDRVDMGAYEFGIGDHSCDGVVTLHDFAFWEVCQRGFDIWPYPPGCERIDWDFDLTIDLLDFAGFQRTLEE